MACCSTRTRARGRCCLTTSWFAAAKKPRRLRFRQGSIWCRARAINCSVPHRRALSWAVAIWSRLAAHIRSCALCARANWLCRRSRPRCASTWTVPMLPIAIFRCSACSRFRRLIWSDVPASCAIVWSPGSIRPVARAPLRWRLSRSPRRPVAVRCLPWSCPRCALPCALLTSA